MAKVSFIVPVFKVEQYLEKCIKSLAEQTLSDIEIILVDDGSPDKCPIICDQYAAADSRIKVLHKENGGVSAARNDGLKLATGEYVIFCDSDDWMEPTAAEILYKKAVEECADIVIGDVYQVYGEERKHTVFYAQDFVTEDAEFIDKLIEADIYRTYCPNPPAEGPAFGYGGPWNKLVKRTLLEENNICFDLRVKGIFDDILYTAHILAKANRISYVSFPMYNYRIVDSSITHSYKPNVIEINETIFNAWYEFFAKQLNGDKFKEAFHACVMRRLDESMKLYFKNKKNTKAKKILKAELKNIVRSEPYREAIRNVNLSKISKKQKLLVYLARFNVISWIYLLPIY